MYIGGIKNITNNVIKQGRSALVTQIHFPVNYLTVEIIGKAIFLIFGLSIYVAFCYWQLSQ